MSGIRDLSSWGKKFVDTRPQEVGHDGKVVQLIALGPKHIRLQLMDDLP